MIDLSTQMKEDARKLGSREELRQRRPKDLSSMKRKNAKMKE